MCHHCGWEHKCDTAAKGYCIHGSAVSGGWTVLAGTPRSDAVYACFGCYTDILSGKVNGWTVL